MSMGKGRRKGMGMQDAWTQDKAIQEAIVEEFADGLLEAMVEKEVSMRLDALCTRLYEQAHAAGMMAALRNADQVLARLKAAADATARGEFESDDVELMQ